MTHSRWDRWRDRTFLVVLAGLVASCSGISIAGRRNERGEAYREFPEDWRASVDRGELRVGMDTNAVYIAWGRPSQVMSGAESGRSWMTWVYVRQEAKQVGYWQWEPSTPYGGGTMDYRYEFLPMARVRASVSFEGGRVTGWQRFDYPAQ